MSDSIDTLPTWRKYVKPVSILLLSAILAGGAVYGIKVSLANTTTTTANTIGAARAQVMTMAKITNDTATAYGDAVKACHDNIVCVNNAATTALNAQSQAAGMVTLDLYPDAASAVLQNFLDDMVGLQKTYLKVSESTTMQKAYTAMQPWPGEVLHARADSAIVLQVLK